MKIGYISFEYPPDTAFGGIATYVQQASMLMAARGHEVSVFCATNGSDRDEIIDKIHIYRINCPTRDAFSDIVVSKFSNIHAHEKFDFIESPEYFGDGLAIKKNHPSLPLVVKLHTPRYLIHELTNHHVTLRQKIRYMLGGLIRGRISRPFWRWQIETEDADYVITKMADQIQTPSIDLGDKVSRRWNIPRQTIKNVPYPFIPDPRFLNIPVTDQQKPTILVGYIGRLEVRKGLLELVKAITKVLQSVPNSKFLVIGKSLQSHIPGMTMHEYILRELSMYAARIEFMQVTLDEIPNVLGSLDVCVFPSIWENFPNVCLEAMSAGRAIVASEYGGMKDMLQEEEAGLLVDPENTDQLAEAIIRLLNNAGLRKQLGLRARQRVLHSYNFEKIGTLMEKNYELVCRQSMG